MATYANQQYIKLVDADKIMHHENSSVQFLTWLDWPQLLDVMEDLNPSEFKVWIYLWKWRGVEEGYQFSPADIEIQLDISESTIRRIKTRFIENKYLVETAKNRYNFIPYPDGVHERATIKRAEATLKHSKLSK